MAMLRYITETLKTPRYFGHRTLRISIVSCPNTQPLIRRFTVQYRCLDVSKVTGARSALCRTGRKAVDRSCYGITYCASYKRNVTHPCLNTACSRTQSSISPPSALRRVVLNAVGVRLIMVTGTRAAALTTVLYQIRSY